MTEFIIDISNNNGADIDMSQVAREGFSAVFAKVSEGDYFSDATWPGYRDAARAAGLLVVGYHYVIAGDDPDAQAARFAGNGGGPVAMLDFENNSGDIGELWSVAGAFARAGITVVRNYIPRWYWAQIGSPDLSMVPGLTASSYVSAWGYASAIYPGDDSAMWAPYGGATPDILQFTDRALVAGHWVDANAFRGSRSELAALLTGQSQGDDDDMTPQQAQQLADVREQLCGQGAGQSGYPGWPELGQNPDGSNRTPVDAIGALTTAIGQLAVTITTLQTEVAALKVQP